MSFKKMEMRQLLPASALALLTACGGGETPVATAAPEARRQAAEAAARLVAVDHADTLAMQRAILDARAAADRYALAGDTAAVTAFDGAFEAYLAEHDAALRDAIFNTPDDR